MVVDADLLNAVCAGLATGKSLVSILESDPQLPTTKEVYAWRGDKEASRRLDAAYRDGISRRMDEVRQMADRVLEGGMDSDKARIALQANQWIVSESLKVLGQYEAHDAMQAFQPVVIVNDLPKAE